MSKQLKDYRFNDNDPHNTDLYDANFGNKLVEVTSSKDISTMISFNSKYRVRNITAKRVGSMIFVSFVFDPTNESFVEIGKISAEHRPLDYVAMATRGHSSNSSSGGVGVYIQNTGTIGLISSANFSSSVTATIAYIV